MLTFEAQPFQGTAPIVEKLTVSRGSLRLLADHDPGSPR